jgi:hypothetical protein
MARKVKNVENCETYTVGPGKWKKNTLKNVENDTQTLYELIYTKKQ